MANAWPLLIEVDCPEPRPQKGRLVVAADGTTWDLAKSSNVFLDPTTLTLMLAPLPTTAAWRTTFAGNYARFQKTDYTLPTAASWKQMQIKASGDYYLQSLNVTERATLTTAWSANQSAYLSVYVPGLKDSDDSVILKAGWGVGSAGSVEVWFTASGGAAVYKSGVLVGSYTRNDSNIAPAAGAVYLNSVNSQFITIMMIPCRRRELVVVASNGLSFSHVFADLSALTSNTITPAAAFSWLVPAGQASVQLAKLQFATSGYAVSPVKKLRYAPPTGATFASTFAYDQIGTGTASASYSVVKDDLTAYTPNGVITSVRAKVSLTSATGAATYGFYEVDMVYQPAAGSTADDPVDITCDVERLSISVDDDGRATCSLTTRRKPITDAGVDQPQITSDRPIRIALSDGAVSPTYIDVFRGTLTPPEITYEQGDTTRDWSVFVYAGQDRSRDFDLAYIVESYPYDGLLFSSALLDLLEIAGYPDASGPYSAGDYPNLDLPYSPNISKGQYALAPDFFDTVGGYLDKLKNDYAANYITGWMPSLSGYIYYWIDPALATTTPAVTLYQSIATATTAGVTEVLRPKRVVRAMSSHYETPEATQVQVVGQDPATGLFITQSSVDSAAETASTAPASRPYNWRGRPVPYQLRDPTLTTQDAVDAACAILYTRLTTGRILIEWESDLLVLSSNNRPLWLGDVVRIMEPDGTTTKGDYRIIGIPTIDFITEQTSGFSVRKAVYRGQKI
jgi:hypothetical protein